MLNEHDLNDFAHTEVKELHQLKKDQYFAMTGDNHVLKVLYEVAGKVYSEVITAGQYQGLAYAIPSFLQVLVYERKH
jgi:hypothetical protein